MKIVLYFIIASITLGAAVADQGEVNKRAENYIFLCYENANLGGRHVWYYTQTFVTAVDCCLGGGKSIAGINSNGIVAWQNCPQLPVEPLNCYPLPLCVGTPSTPVGTGATAADNCGLNKGQSYSVQGGTGVCINIMFNLTMSLQTIVQSDQGNNLPPESHTLISVAIQHQAAWIILVIGFGFFMVTY